MSKNKHNNEETYAQASEDANEINETIDTENVECNECEDECTILQHQLDECRAELEKEKKEYLFLMADFDNFRKRTLKEKSELLRNGGERVLAGLLPIIDDMERGLAVAAQASDCDALIQGMDLVYQKFIKYLESQGVKAMESTGADFDADLHEAIATIPAPSPDLKGKVLDTTQKGYMLNDKVLRHAKVAVGE